MKYTFKIFVNKESNIPKQASLDIKEVLKTFAKKNIRITIEKWSNKRSNSQNAYYWGVVVEILSKELGYEKDEIHEILKYKFLGTQEVLIGDKKETKIKSSSKLTTTEMMGYFEEIQRWAAGLNIIIPDPQENYKQKEGVIK